MANEPDLPHTEARAIGDRALAKCRELKLAGAFAVVDAGGNLLCLSRMGEAPMAAAWMARYKAYVSAINRAPGSAINVSWSENPQLVATAQPLAPDTLLEEPGAMPITRNGRIVGALAAGGIRQLGTAEDQIVAHALQISTASHPGSEQPAAQSIEERVDDLPHCLSMARKYADAVIKCGLERGQHHLAVAVLDDVGQIMQVDRLDGGTMMSPEVAEAKASTALNFLAPSWTTVRLTHQVQEGLRAFVRTRLHFVGGGIPIIRDGRVMGAIGISHGGGTESEHEIACAAVGLVEGRKVEFDPPDTSSHSAEQQARFYLS